MRPMVADAIKVEMRQTEEDEEQKEADINPGLYVHVPMYTIPLPWISDAVPCLVFISSMGRWPTKY